MSLCSQSQWPRRQKRGSEADRLLDCGFEFRWRQGSISPVSVVFCHVEVSASSLSFVRMSPTERGVSECDREASIMRIMPIRQPTIQSKKYQCRRGTVSSSGDGYIVARNM